MSGPVTITIILSHTRDLVFDETVYRTVVPGTIKVRTAITISGGVMVWTVYRLCIWLPILVPAAVIAVAGAFDRPLAQGVLLEVLAYSLLYGGLPYAVLAIWATWWIGGRSEPEIRRLMFRAPLLMAAVFVTLALGVGLAVGPLGPFIAVAMLGLFIILALGYVYVGIALLLRRGLASLIT